MFKAKPILISGVLLVAACTSPVDPQSAGLDLPGMWSRLTDSQSLAPLDRLPVTGGQGDVDQVWWRNFQDPVLDGLIDQALTNNKTLQIAEARVSEARARRGVAAANLWPQINATASAQRGNQGYATNNQTVNLAQVQGEASWELDLFGRNQALTAQATAILQSTEASQQAIRVGLLAEVARTYFELRLDQRQVAIAQANLKLQAKTLQLTQAQKAGALASEFDVQRAAAQVSTTQALIPLWQTAFDQAGNRLNVLLGLAPGHRSFALDEPGITKPVTTQLVVSAPAKVLANRPDVRAAERQLAASIAGQDAARADLFPDISLTALFGAQSAPAFTATPWGMGVNLVQPILNFGRIQGQIDAADAQQRQAFLTYQETVLEALENMENALSGYIHETSRNASLTAGVAQNRKAAMLAQQQYDSGYVGLLDVLEAQRNLLDAESAEASSDADLNSDMVGIYAAAGGGWGQ